jgi:3-oxoacid CoA-transferase B subunit
MGDRAGIARRAARDLPPDGIVNLGRGLPTEVVGHIPASSAVMIQSENGILGMGRFVHGAVSEPWLTNASKDPVTLVPGASLFDLVDSFDMIRGGHVDLVLLGGFEVSKNGDLANWALAGHDPLPPAVGGAMDLATACRDVWVLMTHLDREGKPKLVSECRYPLTAASVVTRIYTDLGTFVPIGRGFRVLERLASLSERQLRVWTDAPLEDLETAITF